MATAHQLQRSSRRDEQVRTRRRRVESVIDFFFLSERRFGEGSFRLPECSQMQGWDMGVGVAVGELRFKQAE